MLRSNGPETRSSFPRQYQWNDFFSQHFRQGYWDVCSPETVRDMSGIGYVFGRRIHMATRVPIGIMDVSRGGTTLATWTPIEELRKIDSPELQSTGQTHPNESHTSDRIGSGPRGRHESAGQSVCRNDLDDCGPTRQRGHLASRLQRCFATERPQIVRCCLS